MPENKVSELVKILDHGHIRRVDYMGSDLSIARNARASYDADWRAGEDEGSDARLIRYLLRNKHNTPFESVVFTFDVKLPIFVTRQWHRHRTQSYNELSARYRELPEEFYIPEADQITTQSTDNKQMRTDDVHEMAEVFQRWMCNSNTRAFAKYKEMLRLGCPRELARTVLPVGTYTHMFCTVNLHNLFGFLRERLHPHAQYEIRVFAEAIIELIRPIVPVALAAFETEQHRGSVLAKLAAMIDKELPEFFTDDLTEQVMLDTFKKSLIQRSENQEVVNGRTI